jgi:hypothetical protein
MRVWTVGSLLLLFAISGFAVGRLSAPDTQAPAETRARDIVVRLGDQLRVPAVSVFCTAGFEIDRAKLLCNHTGDRPRYQVVFESDRTKVGRIGDPGDQRIFPEQP